MIGFVEEKWLPGPYSGLIRRTPLPQIGTSPAPPAPPGKIIFNGSRTIRYGSKLTVI